MASEMLMIHYNDVYTIEPGSDKSAGAARFASKLKSFKAEDPLVLFSGDAFNPSAMSTITKGKHMVPVLNDLGTHVACMGNHDLDFGLDNYLELVKLTTFPWLLSNVTDKAGNPYAGSPTTHTMMWKGRKLGFVGLVEDDWLATLGSVDPETIVHHAMAPVGDKLAKQLRAEGCEFIIALTHSRLPNDVKLAEECPELDMIFGGHDHDYVVQDVKGVWVVKSGTDFRDLTEIRASFPAPLEGEAATGADGVFRPYPKGSVKITTARHKITADLPEDPGMKVILAEFLDSREKAMAVPIGVTECALDARFSQVRTRETNAGNFVADLLRKDLHGDCALINGGTLRADRMQGPGEYKVKDLVDLLPMPTQCVLLEIQGSLFGSILENSVAKYPVLEGRFGQVSGMSFSFDPDQPAGSRVLMDTVKVAGAPLDMQRKYRFVTTEYLSGGKDGYNAFADPSVKVLVDHENGPCIPAVIRNHFRLVNTAAKLLNVAGVGVQQTGKVTSRLMLAAQKTKRSEEKEDGDQSSLDGPSINPKVEGRIVNIREVKVEAAPVSPVVAPAAINEAALSLVFVLGGPGSGKGTNCERIAKQFGYKHLSTGDLLRAEVKSGSPLGKELDAVMKTGGLVDSSMMLKILKGAMTEGNTKPVSGRYLIDGYPRAMDQIESFEAGICPPTFVLAFDAKEEVLEARLLNRGKASGRADDQNVEAIRSRFKTFTEQSAPVIKHYSGHGKVRSFNSERPVDEVYADCVPLFRAELQRLGCPGEEKALPMAVKAKREVVFVLGAPGSGRGTQCELIAKQFGYHHLSTAYLLRAEVKSGSPLGLEIKALIEAGKLVDTAIVQRLLLAGMEKDGGSRFLIAGFPRAMDQIENFELAVCAPSRVIAFTAPEAELEKRILGRGKENGRAEDNDVAVIRKRYATFKEQSELVITHYAKKGLAETIDANRPVDAVWADVRALFKPKRNVVFVLGAPGSGRGTQCERIAKEFNYVNLSTSELLRAEVKSGSALGKEIKGLIETGKLVDTKIVLQMLLAAMDKSGANRFVIAGFPRAMDQIADFEAAICKPTMVVAFSASEKVLEARVLARGKASGRAEDQDVAVVKKRYATFKEQSEPVIDHYAEQGIVTTIHSERAIDVVWADVQEVFKRKIVFVLGAPGTGRGTQCELIAKKFGYHNLSTSELLRHEVKSGSALGKEIDAMIQAGKLVETPLVLRLLLAAMERDGGNHFLIAGFPRAMDQIEQFEFSICKPSLVIAFTANEAELEKRLLNRGKTSGRAEDQNVETIRKRYATYKEHSEMVITHYSKQALVETFNAERSVEEVFKDVQNLFKPKREVVFVLGAPGSGRGTQCERIASKFGYHHLSTAYLLREEVKRASALGKEIKALVEAGKLVDTKIVLRLLLAGMDRDGGKKFLIAGFPRAMDQIADFEAAVCKPSRVIAFTAPEAELEKRILGRGKANGRAEDNDVAVIRKRYATFKEQSEPVITHYQKELGLVATVDANRAVDAVWADVEGLFKPHREVVFVLGAPGSGRGTQCERIAKTFGHTNLSTSELLRAEVHRATPLGKEIKGLIEAGKLVDTKIVLRLLLAAMDRDGGNRFLIAGFPRAMDQIADFEAAVCKPSMVLALKSPEAVLEARLLARGKALGRADDQDVSIIRKRFKAFTEQSQLVIDHYAKQGIVTKVNSDRPVDAVWADVQSYFKKEVVFVLGAPGSGRNTQCELIAKQFGYHSLSTSELLRHEVKSGSALGKECKAAIDAGKPVETSLVLKLLLAAIAKDGGNRFLIAGFPRAMDQIEQFEKAICAPSRVIAFYASEAALEARLLNRGKTSGRSDDQNVETIRKRYATFKSQSEAVIEHYAKKGLVTKINSERPLDAVWGDVQGYFKKPAAPAVIKAKIPTEDLSLVFVLGGPGSGKGTNCERIAKDYGYKHLSTGDLLRAEVKSGSALGKELDAVMKTGGLVDSSMMLKILKGAMTEGNTKPISGRYLIDGYPRAMDQIESFEAGICEPTFVLAFDARESVLEERLLNRGKASGRADDQNVEAIRSRFKTFSEQSAPVITHYAAKGVVRKLNSERPVGAVYNDCKPLFDAEMVRMGLRLPSQDLSLVFVLGGPGSGKGTNCERIAREYGYKHLSTGDLLRAEVKSGSPLGQELDAVMKTGGLVDSSMMLKILKGAMTEGNTKPVSGKYLIDGYPRAMDQIASFEESISKPSLVLAFDAKEEVLEARLLNRGKASGRADDQNVDAIRARFKTFSEQSAPVIAHYEGVQGVAVKKLNSERPVGAVYNDCRPIFDAEMVRMGHRLPSQDLSLVFVLGGPGSGKGTNCERIAREYGYKHLSTGDLLRAEVKSGSPLGQELDAVMKTGGLVDSSMMLKILKGAMTEGNTKPVSGRYLIDGYPRAMDQIESFEDSICKPTFVLAFDAKEEVLEARLLNRGKASGRADDQNVEAIRARFKTFTEQSAPVIAHYNGHGVVRKLNSERPVGEVYNDCKPLFDAEMARMGLRSPSQETSLVFVLGAPGSGKGTNCEQVAREFGYKHLSTGDLLRAEVASGSELGQQLEKVMSSGGLVDSSMMLKILKGAMTEGGTKPVSGKYLIDGYPRAQDQVEGFEAEICPPNFVLAFDASEKVLEDRLVERGKKSGRADDNVDSIRKRFATFKAQSEPVIHHYGAKNMVRKLNSERPVSEVYNDVRPLFMAELRRMAGKAQPTPADLSLVFVLGGPGSGKGTNCERIAKDFHYKHLSTGDLLRAEVKSGSALGERLQKVMATGGLVDSAMMMSILKGAMTEGGKRAIRGRFLIDGFPRALDQVAEFEASICKPTFVLAFDAKEEVLEARLLNRGKASGRADDQNVEAIRSRFKTFKEQSEGVIKVYSAEGLVKALNSERPVNEVYKDCVPIFEAEVARLARKGGAAIASPPAAGKPGKGPAGASPRVAPEDATGAAAAPAGGCCVVA